LESTSFFESYPPEPQEVSVSNAIARMIDGLGYRLYWAMRGLREEECAYRLCADAKSIDEIIRHIFGLVNWVHIHICGRQIERPANIIEQGYETLSALEHLRDHFISIDDSDLQKYRLEDRSFWSFINMPLSDALNHVGQVRILRRAAGNPVEK